MKTFDFETFIGGDLTHDRDLKSLTSFSLQAWVSKDESLVPVLGVTTSQVLSFGGDSLAPPSPAYLFIAPCQKAQFLFQAFYLMLQIRLCQISFINDFVQGACFLFRCFPERLLIFISVDKGT